MKRFLTCAVAVMMLCSLIFAAAGCGSNNAVTLTLLNWGEYLDPDILKEFNNTHDDIRVVEKRLLPMRRCTRYCQRKGMDTICACLLTTSSRG